MNHALYSGKPCYVLPLLGGRLEGVDCLQIKIIGLRTLLHEPPRLVDDEHKQYCVAGLTLEEIFTLAVPQSGYTLLAAEKHHLPDGPYVVHWHFWYIETDKLKQVGAP